MKVGYQGVHGAFSEMAVRSFFGQDGCEAVGFREFSDMFDALEKGTVQFGMFPVENTTTGLISRTYDHFQKHSLNAVGEVVVPINQNLIVLPGTSLGEIREVYSHPEAIAQCSGFFQRNPALRPVVYDDTALSVKFIAAQGDRSKAAIASSLAAELYGMEILQGPVQDNPKNMTRFLCLTQDPSFPSNADKISIMLTLKHRPGALYNALGIFSALNINVLKLESRPIVGRLFEYSFYLDFAGNLRDPDVQEVLRRLKYDCIDVRVFGCYKAAEVTL